ncbi:hypothetical protein TTHERM_00041550 (macronuclear) [Tetrahymena thermophila SB210]|uniref:Kinase domain protein n=1 Tax=Tetrahymena thermophila (strain SB210) TaxID=312017 RepID=Q22LW2_TETTS|nr:hypothetical protein TTHERM_00041550 [Tetrahymena thermophila SB210]EAR86591.2 hypothetical protein TTHERM_00041550 [Tetrahymena thermophila SB210]|eukprot:XP_977258.2 hypothetical protein TTHERM_00041550 [Tetrahymena thermophila SB210]
MHQIQKIENQSDIIDENYALTELYVSVDKQNIQAEGILSLTQALQRLCFLQRLYIEILPNAVHAEGARNLAFSFKYLQNLQKLHLKISQSNNISEMGAKYIEQNLKYLNNLVSFSFSLGKSNFIGKKGFKFLVQGIKNIPNIKIIKFSINPINNISREDFHILIEESCNWRYLIQLSLKIKFADQYSQQLFANNLQIELSKLKYLIKLKCKFPYSNRKHHKYIFMRRVHRLVFAQ